MNTIIRMLATFGAFIGVVMTSGQKLPATIRNRYIVECYDRFGRLKWREDRCNLMMTEGLNNLLDTCLGGTAAEAAWYVGLVDNASFTAYAAADTLASHGGWVELVPGTDYTGNRQVWTKNGTASAGAMSNSAAKAVFPILTTKTVRGAFLCSAATGTAAKIYGAVDFSAARAVENGDTLNVQVDPSIA